MWTGPKSMRWQTTQIELYEQRCGGMNLGGQGVGRIWEDLDKQDEYDENKLQRFFKELIKYLKKYILV